MKDKDFLVKKSKDMVNIFSADGRKKYAFLCRLKNGQITRIFVDSRICGGILAEGTDSSDMKAVLNATLKKIRGALN